MKKRILMLSLLAITGLGTMVFTGCKKKEITPVTVDVLDAETSTSATDNAQAEKTFSDVFDATDDAVKANGMEKMSGGKILLSDCATITLDPGTTVDTINYPKKLTITFGKGTMTDSCLGLDGRWRKGKIHVMIENKRFKAKGSKVTVTLDNFYVDGYHIMGSKTITNNGRNSDANGKYLEYGINILDGKLYAPNGDSATWESTRTRKVYVDANDKVLFYLISGSANGINRKGRAYTINITSPLKVVPFCRWIEEGTLDIIPAGKATRTIDFGHSGCDRLASITLNGKTYQFEMR